MKLIMQNKYGSKFEQIFQDAKSLLEKKKQLESLDFKLINIENVSIRIHFPNQLNH